MASEGQAHHQAELMWERSFIGERKVVGEGREMEGRRKEKETEIYLPPWKSI